MDSVLAKPGLANRILDAILMHTEEEAAYRIKNPLHRRNDPHDMAETIRHYQQVVARYRKQKRKLPEEKATLRYVRHEIRRLSAKQKPTVGKRILYFKPINVTFNFLLRRHKNYRDHNKKLEAIETGTILQYNVQKLQQKLTATGFDFDFQGPLTRQLAHQLDEFSFRHNQPKYPDMDFTFHFKKIPGTDAYTLLSFDAMRRPTDEQAQDPHFKPLRINYANTPALEFSAQDATHIGHNRPVMKNVQGYDTWFIPDATQRGGIRHGNLVVEKELEAWPIKEMKTPGSREALTKGLQDGQVRDITVTLPDKTQVEWKVAVRSDGEGLSFYNKEGKHLDPFTYMKQNGHLEKLQAKALQQKNGKEMTTVKKPGAKIRH